MKILAVICIVMCFFSATCAVYAQDSTKKKSIKEIYELQELCSKTANEFFKKMYGSGRDVSGTHQDYENHYNKKLNKCFIRIYFETDPANMFMISLYDVQENQLHAFYSESKDEIKCYFQGKECTSKKRWYLFTDPYMNE